MGKPNIEQIDVELGREICRKANINFLAIASIRKFGRVYTLDFKLLDTNKNRYFLTASENGEGHESIPDLIDKLAKRIRQGFKEKSSEIQAESQAVTELTTSNLEAYRYYNLGETLLSQFKYREAAEEFKRAVTLDSTFALAHFRLAFAKQYGGMGGDKEAMRMAIKYIDKVPEKEHFLIRAQDAWFNNRREKSYTLYQEVLKIYPQEKEALLQIAEYMLHHTLDPISALQYFEKSVDADPGYGDGLGHLIYLNHALKRHDKAIEYALQFVDLHPGEASYRRLGETYCFAGQFSKAEEVLNRALELFPRSPGLVITKANIPVFKESYETAKAQITVFLLDANSISERRMGSRYLADLYAYQGKYKEIEAVFDKIIGLDSMSDPDARLRFDYAEKAWWLAVGRGDGNAAKTEIEKAKRIGGQQISWFFMSLLRTYLLLGEFDAADSSYSAAIALAGEEMHPFRSHLINGYKYKSRQEFGKAAAEFEKWIEIRGSFNFWDKVFYLYELAGCYFSLGDYKKAIETIANMQGIYITFTPNNNLPSSRGAVYPRGFHLLGKIYEKQGEPKRAIENYEKFLELWKNADEDLPDLIDAKARLARLKENSK